MFDLSGKRAMITGAAKGIGAAICKRMIDGGAIVWGVDLDEVSGMALQSEINHPNFRFYTLDVSLESSVNTFFDQCLGQEKLDILVNNAGVAHIGNLDSTSAVDMQRLYDINVKSVFLCTKAALPYMRRAGGGAIINMASIASVVGLADRLAYSMSKGAVYAMTFAMAKDLLKDNIRCNAIGPARVHTPFVDNYLAQHYPGQEQAMFEKLSQAQPIGRMGTPAEIAALVHYLSTDEASFITGSFYPIDGGVLHLNT
jgi:2-keto-3-deoxy-L-fuconate dehydrogenase